MAKAMVKSVDTVNDSTCSYREGLPVDVRKRYDEKIAVIKVDPYSLSNGDFERNDRENWPDVTNFDIIEFLVFKDSAYSRDQLRNYKSLDAYKYFQDGWVQEVQHKDVNGFHLMKAKVKHSMRIREKPLEPWIIISKDKGIESAHCTCMAGLGECCSHVGSVLFAMEQSTKARDETTVTDVPAYWLYPCKAKFDAPFKRLCDMDFQSAAKKRKQDSSNQPVVITNVVKMSNVPSPTKHEETTFFEELHKVFPKSAVLSLTDKFSEDFKPKAAQSCMPDVIKNCFQVTVDDNNATYDEMVKKCEDVHVNVTDEQVKLVEQETRKQAGSAVWYKQRCGRVTSSVFHSVCHTDIKKPSVSLLKKITSDCSVKVVCAATEWGKKKEKFAREVYRKQMEPTHENFQICESGLYLSKKHYQLAASPDGIIECNCCGKGCIEIKCPYSLRDKHNLDVGWMCNSNNQKCLNRKHSYYYQVQMQLFVTGRDYCDFIVWWPHGFYVERITKNLEFLEENVATALKFHKMCVLPELVYKYFSKKHVLSTATVPINSSTSNNVSVTPVVDHEQKYCICNGTDDGTKMIMCENENCDKQWYHLKCIRMKRVPKGKWICLYCK